MESGVANKSQVVDFLEEVRTALDYGELFLVPREKNLQCLLRLGLTINDVRDTLRRLALEDYCAGPELDDDGSGKEVWMFGAEWLDEPVYIKLRVGTKDGKRTAMLVRVLSFHEAKYPLRYPLRGEKP